MLQNVKSICCAGILALICNAASAALPGPQAWDRAEAALAVAVTETGPTLDLLRDLAASGSSAELLGLLQSIPARGDWPLPAREGTIYSFVQDLRGSAPRSLAPEVLAYLQGFESRVLVAQGEHPHTRVPMFNIRAAASGLENDWKRQEAALDGHWMLGNDPVLLVDRFLNEDDPAVRQGLLDSLAQASAGQLEAICFLALAAVEREPAVTGLAGQAALRIADARALEQLVRTGSGPSISHILRQSRQVFSEQQLGRLMDTAVYEGSSQTASIAIAELAPALAPYPNHAEALMDLLGDPELGASAALALARNASSPTLRKLQRLAEMDDGSLHTLRAQLALDINRTEFAREIRE